MSELAWPLHPGWGAGAVLAAAAVVVWALALYVVSRAETRRVSVLAALAMMTLAAYLGGEALGLIASDTATWAAWLRRTWWGAALSPALWFLLTLALAGDEGPDDEAARLRRWFVPIAGAVLGVGLLAAILGTATELIQVWDAAEVGLTGQRHTPPGPWLPLVQVYVVICLVLAAIIVGALWRASPFGSPLRARFGWLLAAGVLFLAAGLWIVIASGMLQQLGLPGQLLVVLGMLIVGWTVARYGALLEGERVASDFIAFSLTMLGVVVLYGGMILLLAPLEFAWLERALPVLLLVMTTHVAVDTRGHMLDRVLYAPLVGTLRGQLRELSNRVVRQPDAMTALADVRERVDAIVREGLSETPNVDAPSTPDMPPAVRVLVEGALRHMNDLPALSQHALLKERWLGLADTPALEQAADVRSRLEQAIERLRPAGARPAPGSSVVGAWTHYLVLKEAYVDGRPNKQVMQRYALSEGTFHRARRRAVDAVVLDVYQRAASRRPAASSGPTRSTV